MAGSPSRPININVQVNKSNYSNNLFQYVQAAMVQSTRTIMSFPSGVSKLGSHLDHLHISLADHPGQDAEIIPDPIPEDYDYMLCEIRKHTAWKIIRVWASWDGEWVQVNERVGWEEAIAALKDEEDMPEKLALEILTEKDNS